MTPSPLVLPQMYTSQVACIYDTTGKCRGMLTPKRFNIVSTKFSMTPNLLEFIILPPKSFASELLGLLSRSALHDNKTSAKPRFNTRTYMPSPPISLPDHDPNYPRYWSKNPRDRIFGAFPNAFSSKISGFSVCHHTYGDHSMHHALKTC